MYKIIFVFLILLPFIQGEDVDKASKFWEWFSLNEKPYYEFSAIDNNTEILFNTLSEKLSHINPDLTFEFGPKGEIREFIMSAGGIKKAFPDVIKLVDSAPKLKSWKLIKFRQRQAPLFIIKYKSVEINPRDVRFTLVKDNDKIGIMLFHDKYSENKKDEWGNAFYLLLDQTLGEYDVETKVGIIKYTIPTDVKFGKYYNEKNMISELSKRFDEEVKSNNIKY